MARGFGFRPKMCRPSANTENSRRKREEPLVSRVTDWLPLESSWHLIKSWLLWGNTISLTITGNPEICTVAQRGRQKEIIETTEHWISTGRMQKPVGRLQVCLRSWTYALGFRRKQASQRSRRPNNSVSEWIRARTGTHRNGQKKLRHSGVTLFDKFFYVSYAGWTNPCQERKRNILFTSWK